MSAPGPWAGRRLHLIGLGGAGMSGYAPGRDAARRGGSPAPTGRTGRRWPR